MTERQRGKIEARNERWEGDRSTTSTGVERIRPLLDAARKSPNKNIHFSLPAGKLNLLRGRSRELRSRSTCRNTSWMKSPGPLLLAEIRPVFSHSSGWRMRIFPSCRYECRAKRICASYKRRVDLTSALLIIRIDRHRASCLVINDQRFSGV